MRLRNAAALILAFVLLAIVASPASADMGPKPSITFDLIYETETPLEVVEIELFLCDDESCTSGHLLEKKLGPQDIDCESPDRCESLAYGYADYMRLIMTFSDGVTRESDVFEKKHFDATYDVTVGDDSLIVKSTGGRMNPMGLAIGGAFAGACLVGGLLLGLMVLLALNIFLDWKQGADKVWLVIATWVVCVPLLAAGTWFSWIVVATVVIELLIGWLYAWRRGLPKLRLLTMIVLANTVTLLGMLFFSDTNTVEYGFAILLVIEGFIWAVETVILYLTQRRTLSGKEAALLSLLLNGVTFILGLVVPF
jgi:hypothetical protein